MRRTSGFTLVEVLVAISLLAVLALAALGAFVTGHRSLKAFNDGLDSRQQLRAALKMMTDDLNLAFQYPGRPPHCTLAGTLYPTNTCELTAMVYQPTTTTRVASDGLDWADFSDWPGDLVSSTSIIIRYQLIAGTDLSGASGWDRSGQLIRQIEDPAGRIYSSRILLSGLKPFDLAGEVVTGSRIEGVFVAGGFTGLTKTLLVLPETSTGGSADAAQISSSFYLW